MQGAKERSPRQYGTDVSTPIDPGVDIGHVHLKVADIDRSLAFYRDVLGFDEQQRYGEQAAFVSAGGGEPPWDSHVLSPMWWW